jgi:hypothetical protein
VNYGKRQDIESRKFGPPGAAIPAKEKIRRGINK